MKRPVDVFISYRRVDGGFLAQLLEQALVREHVSVFLDKHEIGIGDSFPDKIREAVKEAGDFILVCSPAYFGFDEKKQCRPIERDDDWCRQELTLALQGGKNIFPVDLHNCFPSNPRSLPGVLARVTTLDKEDCPTADDLDGVVKKLLGKFSPETLRHRNWNEWETLLELDPFDQKRKQSFNETIRDIVNTKRCNAETVRNFVIPLIDDAADVRTRFSAYYAAYTFYRRMGDMDKLFALVERCRDRKDFASVPFHAVTLTQYYRFKYERERNGADLVLALEFARKALDNLPENAGVLLSYAELIADAIVGNREEFQGLLPLALQTIGKAMEVSSQSNPKQFCIRGRLLMLQGRFDEAIDDFRRAMDLEDCEKKDAFLRILQYQGFVFDAKLLQMEARLLSRFVEAPRGWTTAPERL